MIGINMPMPKTCENCPFKGAKWCYIAIWLGLKLKDIPKEGRPDWCPLVDMTGYIKPLVNITEEARKQ